MERVTDSVKSAAASSSVAIKKKKKKTNNPVANFTVRLCIVCRKKFQNYTKIFLKFQNTVL